VGTYPPGMNDTRLDLCSGRRKSRRWACPLTKNIVRSGAVGGNWGSRYLLKQSALFWVVLVQYMRTRVMGRGLPAAMLKL